jgi:hypothetical protein
MPGQIPFYRQKWTSLSEYVKEIKQGFTRAYNKKRGRKGTFWAERFKSVIVEKGETLINCLAYIDLNPLRAGLVDRPEEYRWSSLGYRFRSSRKDDFLSWNLGLKEYLWFDFAYLPIFQSFFGSITDITTRHPFAASDQEC